MSSMIAERVRVGSVAELEQRRCTVVSAGGHGIAVFAHDGRFFAVDNRCPHMGFPLSRGTVRDGLLTCHWHHARFDLEGGGTLDPFADNMRSFPVELDGDSVFVVLDGASAEDRGAHWLARLEEGLEHQLEFVLAKASIALLGSGVPAAEIVRTIGRYGLRYRGRGWGMGMTILTAVGSLLPVLTSEDRPLAVFHGAVQVATDTAGGPPRFDLEPLPRTTVPLPRLKAWLRRAVEVRDEDAAERVLQTAIASGAPRAALADLLLTAATDHVYLDAGHVLDFINKACEYLDLVGWSEARLALPSLVPGLCRAQRSEEQNAWRNPIDLVELMADHVERLARLSPGTTPFGDRFDDLVAAVLDDDPAAGATAITAALERGVALAEVGRAVAHAAALRIGRFHTSNEFADFRGRVVRAAGSRAAGRAGGRPGRRRDQRGWRRRRDALAGPWAAARRRRVPRLPDARSGCPSVHRAAGRASAGRAAHAGVDRALPRRARADAAGPAADLPDRGPAAARR
jgi:nitrite reductase/ring-hydroxylating ferredoxin subunit